MGKRKWLKGFKRSSRPWNEYILSKMAAPWVIALLLTGPSCLSALEIKNDLEATNVAGSERMMAMRMLKDYILIAMKNNYGNPVNDLQQTMEHFENAQSALHAYVKDPTVVEQLKEIDRMWIKTKKMLKSPPNDRDAIKYFETMEALKSKADHTTVLLVKKSKHGTSKAVNMAGRLRAISQKLAALYMMKTLEVDASSDMMKKPMEKFRRSLDFLKKASEGDPEALKLVKDLEKTYLFFSVMNESGTFTPSLVVKKTDNMLKTADQLTRRFIEKSNQKGGK